MFAIIDYNEDNLVNCFTTLEFFHSDRAMILEIGLFCRIYLPSVVS